MLNNLKRELIKEAQEKYGEISPCGQIENLIDSFNVRSIDNKPYLIFYFNIIKDGEPGWTITSARRLN